MSLLVLFITAVSANYSGAPKYFQGEVSYKQRLITAIAQTPFRKRHVQRVHGNCSTSSNANLLQRHRVAACTSGAKSSTVLRRPSKIQLKPRNAPALQNCRRRREEASSTRKISKEPTQYSNERDAGNQGGNQPSRKQQPCRAAPPAGIRPLARLVTLNQLIACGKSVAVQANRETIAIITVSFSPFVLS